MHRKIYIYVMIVVTGLLTGCVKSDPIAKRSSDISFSAPVVRGMTKADVVGEIDKYPVAENFCVNAVWTKADLQAWGAAGSVPYMDEVEVAYNAVTDSWDSQSVSGGKPYVWPFDGKLTFAAFSPASVSGIASYGSEGLSLDGFSVPASISLQYDLMYSQRSYNRVDNTNLHDPATYQGVDLVFRHALSSIRFQVKSSNNYHEAGTQVKIMSVMIKDAYSKGDFNEKVIDGQSYAADPEWIPDSGVKSSYPYWSSDEGQLLTTEIRGLESEGKVVSNAILLPQILKDAHHEVKILVTYSIRHIGETDFVRQEAELSLSTKNVDKWEMGKRYIYTITVGVDKIFFSPEVESWENVENRPNVTI